MEQSRFLRPMGFGEILDASVRLYRSNFLILVIAQLPMALIYIITNLTSVYAGGTQTIPLVPTETTSLSGLTNLMMYLTMFLVLLIIQTAVVFPVTLAAETKIASESVLKHSPSLKEAYRFSLNNILKLGLTNIIMTVFLVIVMVIALIPFAVVFSIVAFTMFSSPLAGFTEMIVIGFVIAVPFLLIPAFFWTRWIAAFPIMVNEKQFFFDAINRSWNLVKGRTMVTFLVLLVVYLIPYILQGVTFLTLDSLYTARFSLTFGAGILTQAFLIPLVNCSRVAIYFELRSRKEGFDLERRVEQLSP
ncbi:MAG: glycerophosphoryl diester phosphodiesterase membrane domain-containing protein [Theionarchaea archaeon]|nr:glycerophosphoryl diester phosphodiesterase membrane domain-containing protein [Theionarchaea archaeon]